MPSDRTILYPSFKRYWHLIAATLGFSLLAALFEGFSIGMLVPFLRTLSNDGASLETGIEWVDWVLVGENREPMTQVYVICGIILGATWLRTMFGYLSNVIGMQGRVSIIEHLRLRIVDQLQAVSLTYFSTTRGGEIINTFTNELIRVSHMLTIVITFFTKGTLLLVYVVFMLMVSWELSLIVLVFFGLLSFGLTFVVKMIRRSSREITAASGAFTSTITEFIDGIRTVTAFNMGDYERERLRARTQDFADAMIKTSWRSSAVEPISQLVFGTVLLGIVVFAVQYLIIPGHLDMALLLAFLFALFRLVPIAHNLNGQRGQWASASASLSNVAALLSPDGKPYQKDGQRPTPTLKNGIRFDGVDFEYEAGEPVLKDISLFIPRGKTTAVVGGSGSGKSTLVDLIPRFHDATRGTIYWDDLDLMTLTGHSLRERISIVSQSTFIFNDTIANNLRYGRLDATDAEVRAAAREANALDFIEAMPDGFQTTLGDKGVRLSGGQRQRIAIARALLRDPEILILDEATSALDSISESLVQQSLEQLMDDRTVIAIAHRLSTIENADWVIVLEDGKVVEQGPYAELLGRRGRLHEYHELQFQTT